MKLLIDILDSHYESIKGGCVIGSYLIYSVFDAIANGKPYIEPDNSMELIEVDKLIAEFDEIANNSAIGKWQTLPIEHIKRIINRVQTIEADKVITLSQTANTDEVLEFLRGQRIGRLQGFEQAREKYERPKGEWVEGGSIYGTSWANYGFMLKCSVCEHQEKHKINFCPNCGADMRGNAE